MVLCPADNSTMLSRSNLTMHATTIALLSSLCVADQPKGAGCYSRQACGGLAQATDAAGTDQAWMLTQVGSS